MNCKVDPILLREEQYPTASHGIPKRPIELHVASLTLRLTSAELNQLADDVGVGLRARQRALEQIEIERTLPADGDND